MMTEEKFESQKKYIFERLAVELSAQLTYHNLAHTQDVLQQSQNIAARENVQDEHDLLLLKIAALYHDVGFLFTYKGHEVAGCTIVREELGAMLGAEDTERICGMIMATKLPQTPHNLLEQIICDADLDYLGRDDFEMISNNLKNEFLLYKIVGSEHEWEERQISFFETHRYFTASSNTLRNATKELHLQELKRRFALQYGK